jgi:hypothetical protein
LSNLQVVPGDQIKPAGAQLAQQLLHDAAALLPAPQVVPGDQFKPAAPLPVPESADAAVDATPPEYDTPPDEEVQPGMKEYRLERDGADWGANLVGGSSRCYY